MMLVGRVVTEEDERWRWMVGGRRQVFRRLTKKEYALCPSMES
jgi:hypothetical protein